MEAHNIKNKQQKKNPKVIPKKTSIKISHVFFFSKQIPKLLEQQQIETHKNGVKPFITYWHTVHNGDILQCLPFMDLSLL